MNSVVQTGLRLAVAAVLLTFLLVATHTTGSAPNRGAVLRIAVRTTAGTTQDCRTLSAEELEALPMHMRRPQVCETRAVPYRLTVKLKDRVLLDQVFTAAGIHGDRPLTMHDDLSVPAGLHPIHITLTPELGDMIVSSPPPEFAFQESVEFADGRIRLVALDTKATAFELH